MAKFEVNFDENFCKGCGLCLVYCPKKIIKQSTHINDKGYNTALVEKQKLCLGCKACALMCPEGAISIYKEVEA